MSRLTTFMLLVLSFTLVSCAAPQKPVQEAGLTPLPEDLYTVIDPNDVLMREAVSAYLEEIGAPAHSRYEYSRVDLNNDGRREALVMLHAPYHYWCNFDGCDMAIFKAYNDGFKFVSRIDSSRGPIKAGNDTTNGWRNLYMRVSDFEKRSVKDVKVAFNGQNYPNDLHSLEAVDCNYFKNGDRLFP